MQDKLAGAGSNRTAESMLGCASTANARPETIFRLVVVSNGVTALAIVKER